ncbi:MAG TPA: HIT family protein [Patescibacteria group bacterium]|nr:HIT family protein [Patescibacteria group bacterium]
MYNHEPANYTCPFCSLVAGNETEEVWTKQNNIVFKDEYTTAFVSSMWWPNNKGHVLVIPNKHIENIYDVDEQTLGRVYVTTKKVALALKDVYHCEGVTIRQNNEPIGNQEIWHFHVHVFPRYTNDRLHELFNEKYAAPLDEIRAFSQKLQKYFSGL